MKTLEKSKNRRKNFEEEQNKAHSEDLENFLDARREFHRQKAFEKLRGLRRG